MELDLELYTETMHSFIDKFAEAWKASPMAKDPAMEMGTPAQWMERFFAYSMHGLD